MSAATIPTPPVAPAKPALCCTRLCESGGGGYICTFDDADRKGDQGCRRSITVPPVQDLFSWYGAIGDNQQRRRDEVRDACQKGRAMLVLGAGVSMSANMPGWAGLLSKLAGYAFRGSQVPEYLDKDHTFWAELSKALILGDLEILDGTNALEAGEYIKLIIDDSADESKREDFLRTAIQSIINSNTTAEMFLKKWRAGHPAQDPADPDVARQEAARRAIAADNTLCAVAYLLQAERGFRQALTYNYDTLVQEYLISVFGTPADRIVTHSEGWTKLARPVADAIEIFHLHGCLPRPEQDGKAPAFPPQSRRLILSEDSYYNMERAGVYNWQNSVQSYYFHMNSCVFVGFSAEDYNFRRIIRQLGDVDKSPTRPRHYLLLTVDDLVKDIYASICRWRLKQGPDPAQLQHEAQVLLDQELTAKAAYWKRYGFYPLWVTVKDIPRTLLSFLP